MAFMSLIPCGCGSKGHVRRSAKHHKPAHGSVWVKFYFFQQMRDARAGLGSRDDSTESGIRSIFGFFCHIITTGCRKGVGMCPVGKELGVLVNRGGTRAQACPGGQKCQGHPGFFEKGRDCPPVLGSAEATSQILGSVLDLS